MTCLLLVFFQFKDPNYKKMWGESWVFWSWLSTLSRDSIWFEDMLSQKNALGATFISHCIRTSSFSPVPGAWLRFIEHNRCACHNGWATWKVELLGDMIVFFASTSQENLTAASLVHLKITPMEGKKTLERETSMTLGSKREFSRFFSFCYVSLPERFVGKKR